MFLAIPVNRPIHPLVVESIFHVSNPFVTHIRTEAQQNTTIDIKRNRCAEKFLETECTHLLFWDSDTVAPRGALQKLMGNDKPVVAGVVYMKGPPHTPVFGFWDDARSLYSVPVPFKYNRLLKVDIVGTGFMLIKREVFEKLEPPFFECYEKGGNAREDIYFCLKCRDAGIPVYVDTGLHLGHIATPYIITNETYEMQTVWKIIKRFKQQGKLEHFRELLVKEMKLGAKELLSPDSPVQVFQPTKAGSKFRFRPPEIIQDSYLKYVSEISDKVWAISWELVWFLCKLLHELKPERVLDLGSGFSSFLFRWFIKDVTSVDMDPEWLEKTRGFLQERDVLTDKLMLLKDFEPDGVYDLCLMDIGRAEKDRQPLFDMVKKHCKVVVFDDMHFQKLRLATREAFKDGVIFDLKPETFDAYDRYAWMVIV